MRRSTCYAEAGSTRRRPARQMPDNGAAKESNLPTLGLPGPAGFEGPDWQVVCVHLDVFLFGWGRFGRVRFAEFGTRLGTRLSQATLHEERAGMRTALPG